MNVIQSITIFYISTISNRQLNQTSSKVTTETIAEDDEPSTPAHRTRQSTRNAAENLVKTSDYSSDENLDRLKGHRKEIFQVNGI